MNRYLFIAQRLSAMLLAPLVIIHLIVILYAIGDGLTGAEILARTRGNIWWAVFYFTFVLAVAVHAPIGIRNILREWTSMKLSIINKVCVLFALLLLGLGTRAVTAVI